jgi:hypothetical protein
MRKESCKGIEEEAGEPLIGWPTSAYLASYAQFDVRNGKLEQAKYKRNW